MEGGWGGGNKRGYILRQKDLPGFRTLSTCQYPIFSAHSLKSQTKVLVSVVLSVSPHVTAPVLADAFQRSFPVYLRD